MSSSCDVNSCRPMRTANRLDIVYCNVLGFANSTFDEFLCPYLTFHSVSVDCVVHAVLSIRTRKFCVTSCYVTADTGKFELSLFVLV